MKMNKRFIALILTVLMFAATPAAFAQKAAKTVAPNFGNTDGVTAKQLKEYLTFIASDELEARDTPSRVLEIAPGTGIATVELARRGFRVTAVEMGEQLAAVARRNVQAFSDATVGVSRF